MKKNKLKDTIKEAIEETLQYPVIKVTKFDYGVIALLLCGFIILFLLLLLCYLFYCKNCYLKEEPIVKTEVIILSEVGQKYDHIINGVLLEENDLKFNPKNNLKSNKSKDPK